MPPHHPSHHFRKANSSLKAKGSNAKPPRGADILPPRLSSGYLVRDAHRAFQRLLERRIAPYGVTRGQWYFLRVLWTADGISQRELSARVGMMEPTTAIALRSMERSQLIRRLRGDDDRRKVRVFLTKPTHEVIACALFEVHDVRSNEAGTMLRNRLHGALDERRFR